MNHFVDKVTCRTYRKNWRRLRLGAYHSSAESNRNNPDGDAELQAHLINNPCCVEWLIDSWDNNPQGDLYNDRY